MNRQKHTTLGKHDGQLHGKLTIIKKCKHGLLLCNTCLPSSWVKYEPCESDQDMTIIVDHDEPDSIKLRCSRHNRFGCPLCDYEYTRKRTIYSSSEEEDKTHNESRLVKLRKQSKLRLMIKPRPMSPEGKSQLQETFEKLEKLALTTPPCPPTSPQFPTQGNNSGYESDESLDDYGLEKLFKEVETSRGKDGCVVVKNYYYHTIYYQFEKHPDYKFNPLQLDKCPNTYKEYRPWCKLCGHIPIERSTLWHPIVPRVQNEEAARCFGLESDKYPTLAQQIEEASIKNFLFHFGMTEKWARFLLLKADDYPDDFSGRTKPRPQPEPYEPPSDFFLRDFYGRYEEDRKSVV